jgi:uncharacterized protein YutE (UPF0331/DUF86 family)
MDNETLNRKYNYLIERFEKLKEFKDEYEDKNSEKDKEVFYLAMQRVTEEVVETAIKINIYILKEQKIFPKTYQESFLQLKDFLSEKIDLEKLAKTAKFRNLLAHEYIDLPEKEFMKNVNLIITEYPKYLKDIYEKFN